MIVHHRDFFSAGLCSSPPSEVSSTVGSFGAEVVDLVGTNSPIASSSDGRPSFWGDFGVDENHPPGKKREEVVDSYRERPVDMADAAGSTVWSVSRAGLSNYFS
jgi:hypothetical protein